MGFATVQNLMDDVLNELNLVSGSAVQFYTEPQILTTINNCFTFMFDKRFWDHLTNTTQHTLDGVAGVIIDELVGIDDPKDIEWIRTAPYETRDELEYFSNQVFDGNMRNSYTTFNWDHPQYKTKMFTIYPQTLTGNIRVRARRKPARFAAPTDIVPFDQLAMMHFVVSSMLAADGMNPSSEARHSALFDQRYQDLITQDGAKILRYGHRKYDSFTVAT